MKNLIYFIQVIFLFSSCAFHKGNISSGSTVDCPLMYVATGTASTTKFLGIGGNGRDALILEAKQNLYKKFPYKKGILLSNFSVDFKNSYVLFIHTTKVTVSADVYDCNLKTNTNFVENKFPLPINGFSVGDSVYYDSVNDGFVKATLLKHNENGTVDIRFYSNSISTTFTISTSYNSIFKTSKDIENINVFGFDVGEEVNVILINQKLKAKTKQKCIIKGINSEYAIIEFLNYNNKLKLQTIEKQLLKK